MLLTSWKFKMGVNLGLWSHGQRSQCEHDLQVTLEATHSYLKFIIMLQICLRRLHGVGEVKSQSLIYLMKMLHLLFFDTGYG